MKRLILGWLAASLLAATLGCNNNTTGPTSADTMPMPTGGLQRQTGSSAPPPPPPIGK